MPHQCKTLSLVFTVFENDLLRIIFAPKMFKVAGSWITLDSDGGYNVCLAVKFYHTSPFKKHKVNCNICEIDTNGSGRA